MAWGPGQSWILWTSALKKSSPRQDWRYRDGGVAPRLAVSAELMSGMPRASLNGPSGLSATRADGGAVVDRSVEVELGIAVHVVALDHLGRGGSGECFGPRRPTFH
jgi:hypothetical protein